MRGLREVDNGIDSVKVKNSPHCSVGYVVYRDGKEVVIVLDGVYLLL